MHGVSVVTREHQRLEQHGVNVGAQRGGNLHRITAALPHRARQAQEDPVVQFAAERMVRVHRLALAVCRQGPRRAESPVIGRADRPVRHAGRRFHVQARMEHQQGVVAPGEGMPEEGARAGAVVPVVHFPVAEVQHQIVLIHYADVQIMRGARRRGKKQAQQQGGPEGNRRFHIPMIVKNRRLSKFIFLCSTGSRARRNSLRNPKNRSCSRRNGRRAGTRAARRTARRQPAAGRSGSEGSWHHQKNRPATR